jgi:hypothetical protein
MQRKIQIGDEFGFWTIISDNPISRKTKSKNGKIYNLPLSLWCKCKCGEKRYVAIRSLLQNNSVSCGCKQVQDQYKGKENFSATLFHRIKSSAIYRKIQFEVTLEYLWNLYLSQDRKCAISGVAIEFWEQKSQNKCKDRNRDKTASLDRIDSSKGYIEGNVQWVHKDINFMKYSMTTKKLLEWCKVITEYQEGLNNG